MPRGRPSREGRQVRTKDELRREALAARDAIPPMTRIENAIALADHADALGIEPGSTVSGYWPIRSEIDPRPLMFALRERGFRLALPAVLDDAIAFRELTREGELEPAGFGTVAPASDATVVEPDVILLPLAAFDAAGNRIGYGRGHYDRCIAAMRERGLEPRLVGLAHAAQEVEAVPAEAHDVRLHAILHEQGLHATSPEVAERT